MGQANRQERRRSGRGSNLHGEKFVRSKMSEIFVAFCQNFLLCCSDELLPATATMMMNRRRRRRQIFPRCLQDISALALYHSRRIALERFFVVVCGVRRFNKMDGGARMIKIKWMDGWMDERILYFCV